MIVRSLKNIPWLVRLIRAARQRREKRLVQRWINARRAEDWTIGERLRFTGRRDGPDHVAADGGVYFENDVTIWVADQENASPALSLGKGAFLGQHTYLGVFMPIRIGRQVMIGAYCYLISANHIFSKRDVPIQDQGFEGAPIVIEDGAWLGTHVVVLPGVRIGKGAVIGAGSVVTQNVPDWEIWGGVPARFIKMRPE